MPAAEHITAEVSLIDQLRAAIAAAEIADRAYRAYMADDTDTDDRGNTTDASNAADAEVERLRAEVIESNEQRRWKVRIDGGQGGDCTITACSLEEALEDARQWTRDGNWDTSSGTVYCDVWVSCELTSEEGKATVTIEQDEPDCVDGESHDWQSPHEIVGGCESNPGVWGHGGGVVIHEACMHCGCERTTDTWAQRRDTGEQGLTEVTYEPGKYASEVPSREKRELNDIGCDEMRACAAYVLGTLRGHAASIRNSIPRKARERAEEVANYAARVYRSVPRQAETRAVRLALWLAARNQAEADAAVLVAKRFAAGRS